MDIVILGFVAFYLLIGIFVSRERKYKKWSELREKYSCSRAGFLQVTDPKNFHRFVYAIDNQWRSTNTIDIRIDAEHFYFCGDAYYYFWGWLLPPLKIPFSDLAYGGEKRYWLQKREVVQLNLGGHVVKYGIPKELSENIKKLCESAAATNKQF